MKKKVSTDTYEMRAHYDFDYSKSRANRFAKQFKGGLVTTVVLDPDVAKVFDTSEAVNGLLRSVIAALPKRNQRSKMVKSRKKRAS